MMKKILAALDGSEHSSTALQYTLWLAKRFEAEVTGLYVVDIVSLEGPFLHDISASIGFEPFLNFSSKMREVLESKGDAILDSFKEACEKESVSCDSRISSGVVANEICDKARVADLVVIGRRGANEKFDSGLLGSVAGGVIRKSPKPVLITPRVFKAPEKPLLAYDGSPTSSNAMHAAAEWTKALGLPLAVVTVSRDPDEDTNLSEAQDYLSTYDVEASYECIEGDPHTAIEDYYNKNAHDLLFIGATHHSRIVEMVLGSNTEYLTRSLNGPFLLVR